MLFRRTKFMCPYCFEQFTSKSILFRCVNDYNCTEENDPILADYKHTIEHYALPVISPGNARIYYKKGLPWKAICPKCNGQTYTTICPGCHNRLPTAYIGDITMGVPVMYVLPIRYTYHGAACFFSSLTYTLYGSEIHHAWPDFGFTALSEYIQTWIHENVDVIRQGRLPLKTPLGFFEPLMLQLCGMPQKIRGVRRLFSRTDLAPARITLLFDKVAGEYFIDAGHMNPFLPLLRKIDTLMCFIDLPCLITQDRVFGNTDDNIRAYLHSSARPGVVSESALTGMRGLVEGLIQAIGPENTRRKNLLICFTKADLMWGLEDVFGPLSKRPVNHIPGIHEMPDYLKELNRNSLEIGDYLEKNYTSFYRLIKIYFKSAAFCSFSALGSEPDWNNQKTFVLSPSRILDPILWTLKLEGRL